MTLWQAFTAKYRPGRYYIWLAAGGLVVFGIAVVVWTLFHPPIWLMLIAAAVLGLVTPDPKWVKR